MARHFRNPGSLLITLEGLRLDDPHLSPESTYSRPDHHENKDKA